MMGNYGFGMGSWGAGWALFAPFFLLMVAWGLFWKGLALWHAAKHNQNWWFIILLVVNTIGILEIVYLFGVLKLKVGDLFKNGIHSSQNSESEGSKM